MCEIKIRDQNRIITTKAEPGSMLSDVLAGNGFFIDQDGNMDVMKFDASSNDNTIHWGWLSRTRAMGINWNSEATKEEKLDTLKTAYKHFKETNIYKK